MLYKTRGTCSIAIDVEVENGIVKHAQFINGCPGNTAGISQLVAGMPAEEVIRRLKGIKCGNKPTSCPDQLPLRWRKRLKAKTKPQSRKTKTPCVKHGVFYFSLCVF